MRMKNGKKEWGIDYSPPLSNLTFDDIYNNQIEFQKIVTKKEHLPEDDINWYSYHIQALIEELGELMKADKRWKVLRNNKYDRNEKIEEFADVLITILNIAIFSGFSLDDIIKAIYIKIHQNFERLNLNDK